MQSRPAEKARPRQKVIILQGPTGAGKTAAALNLAEELSAEIINADSMQFYRHMDIGTSKPTADEQACVAHHLFSIINPDEEYNAACYMQDARRLIAEIAGRGKVPLIVGGTGLYIRALTSGLSEAPPADHCLRERLKNLGGRELYARLQQADPEAAQKISPHDTLRMVRALEVYELTGEPLSRHNSRHGFQDAPFDCLKLCLTRQRPELYRAIDERVGAMLEQGLVHEVEMLFSLGYGPQLRPLGSIGYKQIVQHLQGGLSLAEAAERIRRETRHFAKRQLTWFRRDDENNWLELPGQEPRIPALAKKFLNVV